MENKIKRGKNNNSRPLSLLSTRRSDVGRRCPCCVTLWAAFSSSLTHTHGELTDLLFSTSLPPFLPLSAHSLHAPRNSVFVNHETRGYSHLAFIRRTLPYQAPSCAHRIHRIFSVIFFKEKRPFFIHRYES